MAIIVIILVVVLLFGAAGISSQPTGYTGSYPADCEPTEQVEELEEGEKCGHPFCNGHHNKGAYIIPGQDLTNFMRIHCDEEAHERYMEKKEKEYDAQGYDNTYGSEWSVMEGEYAPDSEEDAPTAEEGMEAIGDAFDEMFNGPAPLGG